MEDHKIIKTMIKRGFGIYSINEALSISYSNGEFKLCITNLPGLNSEPIYFTILSRDPREIIEECQRDIDIIMYMYRDQLWEDILYNI